MKRFSAVFARLFAVLVAGGAMLRAAPPNVVFILADDLGWTDLGSSGSDLYRTPHIDKLGAEGMRFDRAYAACNVCSPTRASIMTGRYPASIHVTDWIAGHKRPFAKLKVPDWTMELETKHYNLARAFHDAGYVTAHFGKWHLGGAKYWPEHQRFDVNIGGTASGAPNSANGANGYFSPYGNARLPDGPKDEHLDTRLAREACTFIEQNKDRPFFVNFWAYLVHRPLQAEASKIAHYARPAATAQHHRNATYAAMIEHLDDAVGQILATLDRLGLRENTIIVFTSDNGGLLGTRGVPSAAPVVTNNYPLRAGKGTPYEGGVRVPLLVRYPPVVTAGSKSNVAVISPDFFPTLLDLAGLGAKVTVPANLDGISFAPVLRGERTRLSREAMFWHYPHYHGEGATPYSAILKGPWKLVHFFEDDHLELYDVDRDIWEQHDLTQTEPATRDELFGELGVWRTKVGAQLPTKNPKYDPARGRSRGAQSPDKG